MQKSVVPTKYLLEHRSFKPYASLMEPSSWLSRCDSSAFADEGLLLAHRRLRGYRGLPHEYTMLRLAIRCHAGIGYCSAGPNGVSEGVVPKRAWCRPDRC